MATVLMRTLLPMTIVPLGLVDHHHGGIVRLDPQIFDPGQRADDVLSDHVQRDRPRITCRGDMTRRCCG